MTSNEWAKVEVRLNAGQNLAKLIESADRETLAAIVDQMPTRLVTTSPEPEDAIAEIGALAVRRLAALRERSPSRRSPRSRPPRSPTHGARSWDGRRLATDHR
ncbi:hypothetical protein [Curtobacterium sp. RIT-PI-V]|uniref:hypothetical protein n=1 Tax=Curtobacterium sp. RIT-PI-V TaxID=3035296 RepID=UPI0021D8E9C2|nr:hypothetical protein [Curtobacterium sp. RIT-PI-V]